MPSKIRKKIREKVLKEGPETAGTPVEPIVLRRRMRLFVIVAPVVLWGVALLLWAQEDIDRMILIGHDALRTSESAVGVFRAISRYGMPFIIFVSLCYLVLSIRLKALRGDYTVYLLIILSFGISGIAGDLLKEVFDRPRPFIAYADQIIAITHPKTPSFPSGHATKSMALALPFVVFLSREFRLGGLLKGIVLFAALAVGYARIVLGAHYLSDVLAGIAVAVAGLPLVVFVANRICRRASQEKLGMLVRVWGTTLFLLMLYLIVLS